MSETVSGVGHYAYLHVTSSLKSRHCFKGVDVSSRMTDKVGMLEGVKICKEPRSNGILFEFSLGYM